MREPGEHRTELLGALSDAEVRVREAAPRALRHSRAGFAAGAILARLCGDSWPLVRAAAAAALAVLPGDAAVDAALADALRDESRRVRGPALLALGSRGALRFAPAVRARVADRDDDAEVRAAACVPLGTLLATGPLAVFARVLAVATYHRPLGEAPALGAASLGGALAGAILSRRRARRASSLAAAVAPARTRRSHRLEERQRGPPAAAPDPVARVDPVPPPRRSWCSVDSAGIEGAPEGAHVLEPVGPSRGGKRREQAPAVAAPVYPTAEERAAPGPGGRYTRRSAPTRCSSTTGTRASRHTCGRAGALLPVYGEQRNAIG